MTVNSKNFERLTILAIVLVFTQFIPTTADAAITNKGFLVGMYHGCLASEETIFQSLRKNVKKEFCTCITQKIAKDSTEEEMIRLGMAYLGDKDTGIELIAQDKQLVTTTIECWSDALKK